MAANSQNTRGLVGLGKRFVNQIRVGSFSDPARSPSLPFRRAVHASVYDKNVDDQVRPTVVPDDLIQPESDKYWAPDPKTGVFGPAAEHKPSSAGIREPAGRHSGVNGVGSDSVLEQKTFFRPLEDLEKPTEDSGINPPQL